MSEWDSLPHDLSNYQYKLTTFTPDQHWYIVTIFVLIFLLVLSRIFWE